MNILQRRTNTQKYHTNNICIAGTSPVIVAPMMFRSKMNYTYLETARQCEKDLGIKLIDLGANSNALIVIAIPENTTQVHHQVILN